MSAFEIPLTPQPATFGVVLSGVTYTFTLTWRAIGWFLDIATATGTPMLSGLPLVTGVNLLDGHETEGPPGALYVATDHDTDAVPTFTNLGVTSHLYYVTP